MLTLKQLLLLTEHDGWQDPALSAINVFFCFTLIPMLRHPGKPPVLTSIPTALALLAGGFVFATLHLWLTALTQTVQGLLWLALAFRNSRHEPVQASPGSNQIQYPFSARSREKLIPSSKERPTK
jgi:hypothetical protein